MRRSSSTLAICALLLAGAVGVAEASHPTQMCLDLTDEHVYETSNDDMIRGVQAFPGATDAGHPAVHEGCVTELVEQGQDWTGTNIDFEITGTADPDDGDSPTTPDMTCTVGDGGSGCAVYPPTAGGGTQTIRGWIDFDPNHSTVEADVAEGVDEGSEPGHSGEPDATDVVLWHWSHVDPGPCDPYLCGATDISIRYSDGTGLFFGTTASQHQDCERDRPVKLRRAIRGAPDVTVDRTTTDEYGDWRMAGHRNVRGRYYVVTPRSIRHTANPNWDVDCSKDRSPSLRVR